MASKPLMLLALLILALVGGSNAANISVYWGQSPGEGTLSETCSDSDLKYKFVNIAFLYWGRSQQSQPELDLNDHCNPPNCQFMSREIQLCQSNGIKVLLSIGSNSKLVSSDDAENLAQYLWNTYLYGLPPDQKRPFGSAVLDGIDLHIQEGDGQYWDSFANFLYDKSQTQKKKVYISAAPKCELKEGTFPLQKAINTKRFDYAWVEFFDASSCQYAGTTGSLSKLIQVWNNKWKGIPTRKVFLGLAASPNAALKGGYVDIDTLNNEVLPAIACSTKYGGIMIWNRYYDELKKYSKNIHEPPCPPDNRNDEL